MVKIEVVRQLDRLTSSTEEEIEYFTRIAEVITKLGESAVIGFDAALTTSHQATNLSSGEFLIRFGTNYDLPPDIAQILTSVQQPTKHLNILEMDPANLKNKFHIKASE